MGDRKNHNIMFGPEWLRNMAREQSAGRTNSSQNTGSGRSGTHGAGSPAEPGGQASSSVSPPAGAAAPTPSTSSTTRNSNSNQQSRVRLAKRRYGREEMLALCERNAEPPEELKHFELLYQTREKQPFALNTFEEEVRDNMRGGPSSGPMPPERFGAVRGAARGSGTGEPRGRGRLPFVRHPLSQNAARRPNNHTNWRQTSRDEGDEWRNNLENPGRPHTRSNADKWDRDWSEGDRRTNQDRPQPWSASRRSWVGGDNNNEENLPEWAMDSAEPGAGTFDASGAFHGYSNDDSNLPKSQETNHPLTRSHTHGSFARGKGPEEGSDEWWASDKAKKLSPKRFNADERKPKKPPSPALTDPKPGTSYSQQAAGNNDNDPEKSFDNESETNNNNNKLTDDQKSSGPVQKFIDSNTFGAMARSETGFTDSKDERGSYQSVMINPVNDLRQKHQSIGMSNDRQRCNSGVFYQMLHGIPMKDGNQLDDEAILDELLDMTLTDSDLPSSNIQTHQGLQAAGNASSVIPQHHIQIPPPNLQMPPPNLQMPPPNIQVPPPNLQMPPPNMQMGMPSPGMNTQAMLSNAALTPGMTSVMAPGMAPGIAPGIAPGLNTGATMVTARQAPQMQSIGIHNQALNTALGLTVGGNNGIAMPMEGSLPPVMQNSQRNMATAMHSRQVMGAFNSDNIQMPLNVATNSLFMDHTNPPPPIPAQNDIQLQNAPEQQQSNLYPIGMQRSSVEETLETLYANMMQMNVQNNQTPENPADQWFYEDPEKVVQGPFTSKEMFRWYEAGFFSPSLMIRRATETQMRPLGSYGPMVPFAYFMDNLQNYRTVPMPFDPRTLTTQELITARVNINEALWGQPGPSQDYMWVQQRQANQGDIVNNLPTYFWEYPPNTSTMNLPADIVKDMKTEDEILAQLRAKQNIPLPQQIPPFLSDNAATSSSSTTTISPSDDTFVRATPDLGKLQQLIQSETQTSESKSESEDSETKSEVPDKVAGPAANKSQPSQQKNASGAKTSKQAKAELEKQAKPKENSTGAKSKKKNKEEKKDDDIKVKEEEVKSEKSAMESLPSKGKKEDKQTKKDIEKEKKEWLKEGFTLVKGAEKSNNKESKKRLEEAKAVEELERKKKEEEKLAAEEERKKSKQLLEILNNKQPEHQQRQLLETLIKRAPWSVANQTVASAKDGMTLSEIQRLEREKKLEQVKEQQHMMHLLAQQQAAAMAREQEIQANLAWARNNLENKGTGPTLAEIQAETRRQSAASAYITTQPLEDIIPLPPLIPLPSSVAQWGGATNGGGFWDTPSSSAIASPAPAKVEKPQEPAKPAAEPKIKKKVTISNVAKREPSPNSEFEAWCSTALVLWRTKIDVPTFVGFLKDIESPYEIKDYVKCYLGDTKESNDFARQFLERRSKLLRVGMVTPSDDLCSPAIAVNPRVPLSEYQEVKGKGKKSKKNKMLKVDARILGFSVTASEDRINVGDIDTA
ncbi:GRB10-interacting GYF protein 2 isoform X3 [Pararge aegeria]|nr:GRB10-interacting GYF protein 2 isoform X3 [Pararge aegeria]